MENKTQITILKFGSSVLRGDGDLSRAVHEIYRAWREGSQVLAIVSAFGTTTDELLGCAARVCERPEASALAALVATGEATSAALLGLALGKAGIPASVLDPAQAGLRTIGDRLDAELVAVDTVRLRAELKRGVVVLPGFVGRDADGSTTLLGRGGSDLTALFLAHQLGGRAVLVKDVDGLYMSDPARAGAHPARYREIRYETACSVGGKVVQSKAVRYAASRDLRFSVTAIGAACETAVGSKIDKLAVAESAATPPLRVALLGCGHVGGGVYQGLTALPELFTVTGVGVRNPRGARAACVSEHLITRDLDALIESPCDVVVELIGGVEPAAALAGKALRLGRHVVTANKALLAIKGEHLAALADRSRGSLRYSAAVGGALPALEWIGRASAGGTLRAFSGVLNGTTNFVLDRLSEGEGLAEAVRAAQREGFAEADARLDLDGTDAAQKLLLLAREAFGVSLPFDAIERAGIDRIDPGWVSEARGRGRAVRLIASCRREADEMLVASVKPVELSQSHPLASAAGTENRLLIEPVVGAPSLVCGAGAGRWPTSEAVMADLLDIRRATQPVKTIHEVEDWKECVA